LWCLRCLGNSSIRWFIINGTLGRYIPVLNKRRRLQRQRSLNCRLKASLQKGAVSRERRLKVRRCLDLWAGRDFGY
jgi:hypothetical protein